MRSVLFYTITLSFVLGVLIASFIPIPTAMMFGLQAAALAAFLFAYFFFTNKLSLLIPISIFFILLGAMRYSTAAILTPIPTIESSIGEQMMIEGMVVDDPEPRAANMRFTFLPKKADGASVETKTKIIVTADRYARIAYGDTIRLSGKISLPKNFMTDAGMEFDYVSYLAKDDIRYAMKNPKMEKISSGGGSRITRLLLSAKHAFAASIERALPAPESMLANGILLGTRASFPQSLTDDFVRTSTIHMVALSGYNVTIVAETIMKLFSFLPIAFASAAGIFSIALFAVLAGGGSTVIRASIMAVLLIASRALGRKYDVSRALALACAVMVAINPKILASDVSFELSFLASLGIVYLSPIISAKLGWMSDRFGIREIIAGTLAAQLATFPFILYKTGIFSLVSIPANALTLPFVPVAMLSTFATGASNLFSSILAFPFSVISYALLRYTLLVIRWFASLPFAAITIRHVPIVAVVIFYGLLVYWIIKQKPPKRAALQETITARS